MNIRNESTSRTITRSLAMGVLLSMVFVYAVHALGTWEIENYRPDPETTYTVLLHNKCAVFGNTHTLRPNTDVSAMGESIDGTKLAGSFMNFTEHVGAMVILALVLGGIIFAVRLRIKKNRQSQS